MFLARQNVRQFVRPSAVTAPPVNVVNAAIQRGLSTSPLPHSQATTAITTGERTCQYVGGFLPHSRSSYPVEETDGLSVAVMTAGDVPEFAELFLKARGAARYHRYVGG